MEVVMGKRGIKFDDLASPEGLPAHQCMPADVASAELTNDAPKVFPRSGVLYDTFSVRWFGLRSNRSLFFLFFFFQPKQLCANNSLVSVSPGCGA